VSFRQALLAVFLVAASAATAAAQVRSVDIVGVVTDPSGGVLPGVTVTATNLATNDERRTVSDDGGRFAFRLLPVGKYSVKAELSGFRTWSVAEVTLAAGDTLTLDPRLEIGAATETVVVTAEAPVLQRQSSTIMALIDQTAVQDLPLNGRNRPDSRRRRQPDHQIGHERLPWLGLRLLPQSVAQHARLFREAEQPTEAQGRTVAARRQHRRSHSREGR
jgi:hypothetical protein